MSLDADFKEAVRRMKVRENVPQDDKLLLYALFQQATKGDCNIPQPSSSFKLASQMWQSWKGKSGLSSVQAMKQYIKVAQEVDEKAPKIADLSSFYVATGQSTRTLGTIDSDKSKKSRKRNNRKKPTLPALPPQELRSTNNSSDRSKHKKPQLPTLPSLPPSKPLDSIKNHSKIELLNSPRLSRAMGVNPLSEAEDDIGRREIYEKIRHFYEKINKGKLNSGIGDLVEWTLEHGEKALNRQLLKKYGENLLTVANKEKLKMSIKLDAEKEARRKNVALSQRLRANATPETREKLDKLTKFLLVNDPELVERGMYIMLRFIEKKGIGALNENLMEQYGKSLEEIGDDEINAELKKKYGNDLSILNEPLIEMDDAENGNDTQKVRKNGGTPMNNAPSIIQSTLQAAIKTRGATGSKNKTTKRDKDPKKDKKQQEAEKVKELVSLLTPLLKEVEPDRFDKAIKIISNYGARHGMDKLNSKLREKYGTDLNSFHSKVQGTKQRKAKNNKKPQFDADKTRLKLAQFLSKHDPSRMDLLLEEFMRIGEDSGYESLNNYLYQTYGEHLEAVSQNTVVMSELHSIELSQDIEQMLNSFYAKYDPMILATDQVRKIFDYAKRNGVEALDINLKKKYNESLTEFMDRELAIRKELVAFYKKFDESKIHTQLENIISWTMINGRDALNMNLRKKYKQDLDSDSRTAMADIVKF
mmetsp:Transcript_17591/g.21336  ORF Transcript_17591/g.21336 Transcript_17591/m.21336 type:complete len:702 (-) Transcript_17591:62-2167(-)